MLTFTFQYILNPESIFDSSTKIRYFNFMVLPFGMSLSSWIFTKLMEVVSSYLRQCAISVFPYLEDWLVRNLISQSITVSDKILPSSNSESGFYSKPKKVRINTCSEIHVQRHGISDTAEFNQGSSGMSQDSNIDCHAIKYRHKLSFLFWANSLQQQISLS